MTENEELRDEIIIDEEKLINSLEQQDIKSFRDEYLMLHPYDRAVFYEKVGPEHRKMMYFFLSPKELAEIFETSEIDEDEYKQFLQEMDTTYAADMISHMFVDNAVDVLKELDKAQTASYLTLMNKEAAAQIKSLLHYEEYTAGSIMTTEYVSIPQYSTVRSAMTILRNEAPSAETIYYVFVVDEDNRLTGVVSLRDLIITDEDTLIQSIMNERVVSVLVSDDQEDVARTIKTITCSLSQLSISNSICSELLRSMILSTLWTKKHPMTIPNLLPFPIWTPLTRHRSMPRRKGFHG